ncbi:MAG: NADH:flavin oxidoreductase [Pseudomonadota bacterium]
MKLFKPVSIGALRLKNRLVMAPLLTNLATKKGEVTPELVEHYRLRAEGGVGLIVTEGSCIDEIHRMSEKNLGAYDDRFIPALKDLTRSIHEQGGQVAMQLVHAMGMRELKVVGTKPSELTLKDIKGIIANFAQAGLRAKEAGFDAVEFHFAHWYTVADFMSLAGNDRTDKYGKKNLETRTRLAVDILHKTREAVGQQFPLICRISGDEYVVGGNTLKQTVPISQILADNGADSIHVSAGNRIDDGGLKGFSSQRGHPDHNMPEAVNIHLAEGIKNAVTVPVIGVGRIGLPQTAEEVIVQKKADLVALGRALVADPFFPQKAQAGDWDQIKYCNFRNECWLKVIEGKPLSCVRP